jgi:hypothetical protein
MHKNNNRLLFGSLLLTCIYSALPPGFQDEIYCPHSSCLKQKIMPSGYSGPQIAFKECCRPLDALLSRPKAWGFKLDPQIKIDLIDLGWHTDMCTEEENNSCTQKMPSLNLSSTSMAPKKTNNLLFSVYKSIY